MSKFAFALAGLLAAASAHAVPTVTLHSSNIGIGSISVSVVGTLITIDETWTSTGPGILEFSGLAAGVNYQIVKNITNNTGVDWSELANELLDPAGNPNDASDKPNEAFVPAGFSHSNDGDGLSFAQGSGETRDSDIWDDVDADELSTVDFLDYSDGLLSGAGGTGNVRFSIRDNIGDPGDNQPFLLVQRPNERTDVPAPAALGLFGLGLILLAARRRG
jgi:hypothetical protein